MSVEEAVVQLSRYADDEFANDLSGDPSKGCGFSLKAYEGRLCEGCETLNPKFAPYVSDFGGITFYPIQKEGYPVRLISMAHDSTEVENDTEEGPLDI